MAKSEGLLDRLRHIRIGAWGLSIVHSVFTMPWPVVVGAISATGVGLWAHAIRWGALPVTLAILVAFAAATWGVIGALQLAARWRFRSKPSIPIAFELNGQGSFSAQYRFMHGTGIAPPDPEPKALVFDFRDVVVTNISRDRAVSLDFAFRMKGKNGQRGDFTLLANGWLDWGLIYGRTDSLGVFHIRTNGAPLEIFTNPVAIGPEQSFTARLVFLFCPADEETRGDLVKKITNRYFDTEIQITDRVSGVTISVPETVRYRGK